MVFNVAPGTMKPGEPFIVLADTREQAIPPMPDGVAIVRRCLREGDYTLESLLGIGVVERKSAQDFAQSITWSRERFDREIARLQTYRWKCIVVEEDLTWVYRCTLAHRNSILGTIASYTARHDCPVIFAGDMAGGDGVCGAGA